MIDRGFKTQQIFVHKQAPYSLVVQKMKREIFGSDAPSGEYYIANASGTPVSSGDSIVMSQADGAEQKVPWSLETYLKVSKIKYQSKARFYCVQKLQGKLVVPTSCGVRSLPINFAHHMLMWLGLYLTADPEDAVLQDSPSEPEDGSQITSRDQPEDEEEHMQHSSCSRPCEPEDGSQVTSREQDKKDYMQQSACSHSGMYTSQ